MIHILFMLIGYFPSSAQDHSVLQKQVSINHQASPLNIVLADLSKQTSCYFSYDATNISGDRLVSIELENITLEKALQHLFEHHFKFTEYKNLIIISELSLPEKQTILVPQKDTLYRINGRIVDEKGRGLPHATVHIRNTYLGTSCNGEGYFSFGITQNHFPDTVEFSFIGYTSNQVIVEQMQADTNITLTSRIIPIQEVLVRNTDPVYIVNRTVENILEHTLNQGYVYEAFYREYFNKDERVIEYSEAAIEGYKYKRKHGLDRTSIIKSRNIKKITIKDTVLVKLKGGIEACSKLNVLKSPPDFIDIDRNELYQFYYSDIVSHNKRALYSISFEPKDDHSSAMFYGTMYIDTESYALIMVQYGLTNKTLDILSNQLVMQKGNEIKIKPKLYYYQVEYAEKNGKYYAKRMSGQLKFNARLRTKLFNSRYMTSFEMIVTEIAPGNENTLSKNRSIKTNTVFSELISTSPQRHWPNVNTLLPENEIIQLTEQSATVIQTTESY